MSSYLMRVPASPLNSTRASFIAVTSIPVLGSVTVRNTVNFVVRHIAPGQVCTPDRVRCPEHNAVASIKSTRHGVFFPHGQIEVAARGLDDLLNELLEDPPAGLAELAAV